jgi:hypothetical protein
MFAGRDRLVTIDLGPLQAEQVVAVGRPAVGGVQAPAPKAPPWATITPWAPLSGMMIWAVTAWDLFLMTTTEFSDSRLMPPNSSWRLPQISWGRPARSALKRSTRRSSNGKTLYLLASSRNSRCSSCSLSGWVAARSWAWVQSVLVSYSSQTSSSNAGSSSPITHGVLWRVTAVQPLW